MITSFANKGTEDIWNGLSSKEARATCPTSLWNVAFRKLDMVNAAQDVIDLRSPPGNSLEKLKGDLAGKFSIRINQQFRVVFAFAFANGQASDVEICDYH